jgi:hypothetical protein
VSRPAPQRDDGLAPAGWRRPACEERLDGGRRAAVGVRAEHGVADVAFDHEPAAQRRRQQRAFSSGVRRSSSPDRTSVGTFAGSGGAGATARSRAGQLPHTGSRPKSSAAARSNGASAAAGVASSTAGLQAAHRRGGRGIPGERRLLARRRDEDRRVELADAFATAGAGGER